MERSAVTAELQWSARRRRRRWSYNGALGAHGGLECGALRRWQSCNGAIVARGGASMEHSRDGGGAAMERSSPVRSCNGVLVTGGEAAMECSLPAAELQLSGPMQHSHEGSRCFIASLAGGSMQHHQRLSGLSMLRP
ncbi:hypothetical protein ACQJBY_034013 [Aegilops geniculata]